MLIVPSTLDAVTVYAEGALCTRLVSLTPTEGRLPTRVRINGLPLTLRPGSLRASVLSGPSGLAVRDVRPVHDVQLPAEPDLPITQRTLEEAQERLARLGAELERLQRHIQSTQRLRPVFPVPREKQEPQPREAALTGALALASFVEEDLERLHARRLELERLQREATAQVETCRRRLKEGSTAARGQRAQLFRAAVLTLSELEGAVEAGAQLALEYAVDGARWVPGYDLRLPATLEGGTLTLRASVLQRTGEDWWGVRLALSTADMDRRAELPELKALRIGRHQPAPARSGWREPPAGLDELFAGFDAAGGSQRRAPPSPRRQELGTEPTLPGLPVVSQGGGAMLIQGAQELSTPPPVSRKPAPAPSMSLAPPMPRPAAAPMAPPMMGSPAPAARGGGDFSGGPPAPPIREKARKRANVMRSRAPGGAREEAAPLELDEEDGGGTVMEQAAAPSALEPASNLLDYADLEVASVEQAGRRGRLQPRPSESSEELLVLASVGVRLDVVALVTRQRQAALAVRGVTPPPFSVPPRQSTPHFDYRYEVERRVDVPSDAAWHLVPVLAAPVGLVAEYVCVPSVEPLAFRTLKVENRTPHALLAGPVDVRLGEEFLMTSPLPTLAPGAVQRLGLGVEESLKVSRNTRFEEASGGMFGGASVLTHHVSIEVANRLGRPVTLEVRERVPVPEASEKDIKVEEAEVRPSWSRPAVLPGETPLEGERAWRVVLQPDQKQTLDATYVVRIPSSKVLQGGNRRT